MSDAKPVAGPDHGGEFVDGLGLGLGELAELGQLVLRLVVVIDCTAAGVHGEGEEEPREKDVEMHVDYAAFDRPS